jgi:hypothetical protein
MYHKNLFWLVLILGILLLSGCEKQVSIESSISPDGEIDRTISYEQDTSVVQNNMFATAAADGWKVDVEKVTIPETATTKTNKTTKYRVVAKKHFASAEQANKEKQTDSTFGITSSFQKQFRWFYTYLKYTDTYRSLNRFRNFPQENYFSQEDFDFIHRMPAEGKRISKADSIYLDRLSQKIGDYFSAALFEEHFAIAMNAGKVNNIGQNWMDSISQRKGEMFNILTKDDDKLTEDAFLVQLIPSVVRGFPVEKIRQDYLAGYASLKPRIEFMTTAAAEMHFEHRIIMPGKIVSSTADSTSTSIAIWKPMPLKFMLEDYAMEAESRSMNYWAVGVTGVFVLLTP